MQSLQRQIKRGRARVKMSEFVKNEDGTQKVIIENFPNDILNVGVVKKSDSKRSFIPKAYLVLKNDKPLTTELINEIIKTCSKNLPSYAIPVEFEQIDQLPLTTAKKTDYNQLDVMSKDMITFAFNYIKGVEDE